MRVVFAIVTWLLTLSSLSGAPTVPEVPATTGHIMCCDQTRSRLLLLDAHADWDDQSAVTWSWSAASAPDITREHVPWFAGPLEAKPVLNGSHVLACFSGQGVALIRLSDKKVIFYANAGGRPHSAELLPDGNIVTASSEGGYLRLFRTDPAVSQFPNHVASLQVKLLSAHGVLWDAKGQRLWALGDWELKRYRYDRQKPDLIEEAAYELPGRDGDKPPGGHNLSFNAAADQLFVTTVHGAYLFDPSTETFAPFEPISRSANIKSVSQLTPGGPVIIMRATENWWSDTIRFVDDDRVKKLPGARFYKARWWPAEQEGPASRP